MIETPELRFLPSKKIPLAADATLSQVRKSSSVPRMVNVGIVVCTAVVGNQSDGLLPEMRCILFPELAAPILN